jgi:hypothetical protein
MTRSDSSASQAHHLRGRASTSSARSALPTETTVRQFCASDGQSQWTHGDSPGRSWNGAMVWRPHAAQSACGLRRQTGYFKRRGRDLNPRGACTPNGFRDFRKYRDLQDVYSSCATLCASERFSCVEHIQFPLFFRAPVEEVRYGPPDDGTGCSALSALLPARNGTTDEAGDQSPMLSSSSSAATRLDRPPTGLPLRFRRRSEPWRKRVALTKREVERADA